MSENNSDNNSELTTRISTTPMLDSDPPAFRVRWIAWDSGFRGTGLRIGDQILAVNGKIIDRPATPQDVSRFLPTAIGQYDEARTWESARAHAGDPVTLRVRRRKMGAVGWETVEVKGKLVAKPSYTTREGRMALAPGGPDAMEHDGFNDNWGSWYDDQTVPKFTSLLDGAWETGSFTSRFELQQHLLRKPQLDYAVQHYPGTFATQLKADWQAVFDSLNGAKIALTDVDLKYRRAEDDKVQHVKDAGIAAAAAFQKSIEGKTISPFPALNPVRGDPTTVVGKYVVLPPIRNADWLDQGGRTFFAFGSPDDGYYFAEADSPGAQAMLLAMERYRRLVSPSIDESWAITARITSEPALKVISGEGYYGLEVEIVAATIGEAMFVDVSKRKNAFAAFASEELFDQPMHPLPADSATPQEVMQALFNALKTGDMKLWKALFADWYISNLPDGTPLVYLHDTEVGEDLWEASQRSLLTRVFDMRVAWTGDPRQITSGKEFKGAPRFEEVDVEIDHVGSFEGEYRVFKDVTVNRNWTLQRMDGGPWRISTIQAI